MDTATSPPRLRTRLPHVLATLYGIAIVYASLEPFHPWLPPQTSFFLFDFGSARWIRYDALLNVLSYVPFGFFIALLRRGVSPTRRIVHSVVIGAAMSFAMESLQMYVPPRVASPFDLAANIVGALGGGALLAGAIALPRPVQVALCAIALLSALLAPVLAPESLSARAPLAIFDWHYGQLLNYNGLTRAALLVWPLLTAAWLFALAGRPSWGKPPDPG